MKNHSLTALITCLIVSCLTANAGLERDWIAVGDDGHTNGPAAGYVIALSQDSAMIVTQNTVGGGWTATPGLIIIPPEDLPIPSAPGTAELFEIDAIALGMAGGVWFGSIKAFDESGNYGALGNIVRFDVDDLIAPAAIMTFQ